MSAADNDLLALEKFLAQQLDLRRTLHGVQQSLGAVDSYVSVSSFALRAQGADIDSGVAAVLDAASNAIQEANHRLAMVTMDGAEKLDLRPALDSIRDRLKQLDAGVHSAEQVSAGEDAIPPRLVHITSKTPPLEELLTILNGEYRNMQRMEALMIAFRFAVEHECEKLDPADVIDGILQLLRQSLERIDRWEAAS